MAESDAKESALASPQVATLPILLTALAGLLFLALSMIGFAFVYAYYGPSRAAPPPEAFPAPELQPDDSSQELDDLLAKQRKQLQSYGWANAEHTLVIIPIARAMQIIAGRGAKGFDPIVSQATATSPPPPVTGAKP
jgi:hypothetical protein